MSALKDVVWDEFLCLPTTAAQAERCGFLEALPKSGGRGTASFACPSPVVGRRLLKLWKSLKERSFSGKITPGGRPIELNRKLGRALFVLPEGIVRDITAGAHESESERWAWFRGLWGGCGALYLPQSGYYMTLRPHGEASGRKAAALLGASWIALRKRVARGRAEYTLRDQDLIVTCLLRMGLVKSSLFLEETAMVRSIKNRVNKVMNCDSANISKTVDAAVAQLAMVDAVDSGALWDHLSPVLAELARMRRIYPSASLAELGQMLSKPVSKSTVEYRWRKLKTLLAALGR